MLLEIGLACEKTVVAGQLIELTIISVSNRLFWGKGRGPVVVMKSFARQME
jgi:hypothetical protein